MKKRVPHQSGRSSVLAVMIFALISSVSCQSDRTGESADEMTPAEFGTTIQEPVERDFEQILEEGVLRMITHYSSNTYFLHQGVEVGFEYELLRAFARQHDLVLEVVIIGNEQNPFELLNSGEGDVIAANYAITPERERLASFTRPYNLVDQMVVFPSEMNRRPETLDELAESNIPVTVARNSSYFHTLQELKEQGHDLNINVVSEDLNTESLLFQLVNGTIEATVSDDNMYQATSRYLDGLDGGPVVAERDSIAWAVRENAPELNEELDRFLYGHFRFTADSERPRRSEFLNVLRQRYFVTGPQIAEYFNPDWHFQTTGLISPYDDMVQTVADSLELDWLMLTSMIAQESQFNPASKSWAGAVGLMQIIPRFSEIPYEELYEPETNLWEGARIIREHLDHYAYMDSLNQWSFALATYNVGIGHMADARRLTIDRNRNPNEWEDVSESLLMLMQRRHYQDARYGFARGIETVQYVEEILNRYRMYDRIMAIAEWRGGTRMPGLMGAEYLSEP